MGSVRRSGLNRYLVFLGLNVVVSAITVLIVLSIWDRRSRRMPVTATSTIDVVAQVASAVPTPTSTVRPSPTPVTYMVRSGDTLTDIALKLEVSVEALMAANGITDPNTLSVGQVLVVPQGEVGGSVLPTATRRLSTPTVATTVSMEEQEARVVIYGVEGVQVLEAESVRLLNTGGEVSMAGWILEDGEGHQYTFPVFTFYTTGAVYVHTRSGTDTSIDLYWGLDEPVWGPGKVITLRDAPGEIQDTFQIPES